jgi:hypothetical protein
MSTAHRELSRSTTQRLFWPRRQPPPAAAEPRLPLCPAAGLPMLQPSPLTGHHKVSLSWNASAPSGNSESKAVGCCLYRSQKENLAKQSFKKPNAWCSDCERINSVAIAGTGCVDDLVEDGATYYYIVPESWPRYPGRTPIRPSHLGTLKAGVRGLKALPDHLHESPRAGLLCLLDAQGSLPESHR